MSLTPRKILLTLAAVAVALTGCAQQRPETAGNGYRASQAPQDAAVVTSMSDVVTRDLVPETIPLSMRSMSPEQTWTMLVDADGVLGMRLSMSSERGGWHGSTFFSDESAEVWRGLDLVKPEAQESLVEAVIDALRRANVAIDERRLASGEARSPLLNDIAFDKEGRLLISVAPGTATPPGTSEIKVVVAAEQSSAWLTEKGLRVSSVIRRSPAREEPITLPSSAQLPLSQPASLPPSKPAPQLAEKPNLTPASRGGNPDCSVLKCVALTFDDGPNPNTHRVLDALDAAGVKATFFLVGSYAAAHPDIVAREIKSGMVVANHTLTHQQLTKLSVQGQSAEVNGGADAIARAGAPRPTWFRPPYGSHNAGTATLGYPIILWDVDTLDWKHRDPAQTLARVQQQTRRGSIILMHDIHPTTGDAVPSVIAWLTSQGYTLVTLPQLLGTPVPGKVSSNGQR